MDYKVAYKQLRDMGIEHNMAFAIIGIIMAAVPKDAPSAKPTQKKIRKYKRKK